MEKKGPREARVSVEGPLCLSLLLLGAGYAWPLSPVWNPAWRSPEIANLFSLAAWMGLAHFYFAFRGQTRALRVPASPGGSLAWGLAVAVSLALLLAFRHAVPRAWFDAAVWVYFLPHFLKAEFHFGGGGPRWGRTWFPTAAFVLFSAALFGRAWVALQPWALFAAALALAGCGLPLLARRDGEPRGPLVMAFVLIGESLVWGTYGKYMSDFFADGLYTFHVAGASFYHYFRAYAFAAMRAPRARRFWLEVVAVNLVGIGLGAFFTWRGGWLALLFSPAFFTFWVGLHLAASDWHPPLRRWMGPR